MALQKNRFSQNEGHSTIPELGTVLGSHRPFGPKQLDIYKKTRELFDRAMNQGHFGVSIIKIRRLSFFSQIGTRFLPLLIRKLKKSVSRSILGLEKRYTHANRSEFHHKTIGIETCSLRGPLLRDRAAFAFLITYGQSPRLSALSLRPEGSPIYKNTRELFESGSRLGHFGVSIFKIRRLSYFAQKFD